MTDLFLLQINDLDPVRCVDLNHAENRIKAHGSVKGKAVVSQIPEGKKGGRVINWEYSFEDGSWIAHQASDDQ